MIEKRNKKIKVRIREEIKNVGREKKKRETREKEDWNNRKSKTR